LLIVKLLEESCSSFSDLCVDSFNKLSFAISVQRVVLSLVLFDNIAHAFVTGVILESTASSKDDILLAELVDSFSIRINGICKSNLVISKGGVPLFCFRRLFDGAITGRRFLVVVWVLLEDVRKGRYGVHLASLVVRHPLVAAKTVAAMITWESPL
jgi:hypothetical protein